MYAYADEDNSVLLSLRSSVSRAFIRMRRGISSYSFHTPSSLSNSIIFAITCSSGLEHRRGWGAANGF
jgi:hypothetical protein